MKVNLPSGSLFSQQDYQEMADLVDDEEAMTMLEALDEDGECFDVLVDRLAMPASDVADILEDLRRVALASMHRRPEFADRRYHRRTRLGTVVLEEGHDGVRQLAQEEWDLVD